MQEQAARELALSITEALASGSAFDANQLHLPCKMGANVRVDDLHDLVR